MQKTIQVQNGYRGDAEDLKGEMGNPAGASCSMGAALSKGQWDTTVPSDNFKRPAVKNLEKVWVIDSAQF